MGEGKRLDKTMHHSPHKRWRERRRQGALREKKSVTKERSREGEESEGKQAATYHGRSGRVKWRDDLMELEERRLRDEGEDADSVMKIGRRIEKHEVKEERRYV